MGNVDWEQYRRPDGSIDLCAVLRDQTGVSDSKGHEFLRGLQRMGPIRFGTTARGAVVTAENMDKMEARYATR